MDLSVLGRLTSARSVAVSQLPILAAAVFLLFLVGAGAPVWLRDGEGLSFGRSWERATGLGAGGTFLLTLVLALVSAGLAPFQLSLLRVLEGGWPDRLGGGWARDRQRRHRDRLRRETRLDGPGGPPTDDQVVRAGRADARLRGRYPQPDHLLRPTALGNALAAAEDTAGRDYGMDAVVIWPRLYPVLGENVRGVLDDRRNTLDAAGRTAVTAAVTTVASAVLLARSGWPVALVLLPALLAGFSYHGAVLAAVAYGESVRSAFDLHRFDLLDALRLPFPGSPEEEARLYRELSGRWRQGMPMTTFAYREKP